MLPNGEPETDDEAVGILEQADLRSFTATPSLILPFGASLLEWDVRGPAGFSVLLSNRIVPRVGSQLVTPLATRAYGLVASSGRLKRPLGSVTVIVDDSACQATLLPNFAVGVEIQSEINNQVANMSGVQRRKPDEIQVNHSGIHIKLALFKSIDYFPDPKIDIDAQWTYEASNGQATERIHKLDVSVSVPWYAWAYPGALPGLAIALGFAREDARRAITDGARRGAERIEGFVPSGFRLHLVGFTDETLDIKSCPESGLYPLLPPRGAASRTRRRGSPGAPNKPSG